MSATSTTTDLRGKLSKYVKNAAINVWLMALGVVVVEIVLIWLLPIGRTIPLEMWLLIPLILFITRTRLSQGIIRGAHHAGLAIAPDGIVRPGLTVLGLTGMLIFGIDATGVLIALMLFSAAVGFACGKTVENSCVNSAELCTKEKNSKQKCQESIPANFSHAIYASSILAVFASQMAVIAIGNLAAPEEAGLYAAAERFALSAALIGQAVYLAVASRIAAYYSVGDLTSLRSLVRRVTRSVIIATACISMVMFVAAEPLLGIYGKEFVAAHTVFVILMLSVMVNVSAGPVGIILLMTRNEKKHLLALSASVATQAILLPVVVPVYGMVGTACVVFTSTLVWNCLMAQFVHRHLSINRFLAWA